ncbi:MAG: ParB N-terminal domain-containing protein [Proteobacteria bacterium]|nr:ParB N-terminal domain-containing protein [Pseudomonadota bacterium]
MENNQQNRFPVESSLLEFDRGNPRLVAEKNLAGASDEEVIAALVDTADIGELVNSIVANGYMDIEPLIVTKKDVTADGNYRVLEGNRRLAAIRLIQDPALAAKSKLLIPKDIPDDVHKSFKTITVYAVENEIESRKFIGFKHINGAHRWDSYAKARFLTDWYKSELKEGVTIESIAQQLGDKNQTVRNLIGGMLVLEQAQNKELFEIDDRNKPGPFGFSHLYTALNRIQYREFLGLDKDWNQKLIFEPIKNEKEKALQEVLYYIYGSKKDDIKSVIKSQNPNLRELGEVLAHPLALSILRSTNSLEKAMEEVLPAALIFNESFISAHTQVADTLKKSSKFSAVEDSDLLPLAIELEENSNSIRMIMEKKIDKLKKN